VFVAPQVGGQYPVEVMAVEDQQPVQALGLDGSHLRSAYAFAIGACGGIFST
jgi:hypothetical protein